MVSVLAAIFMIPMWTFPLFIMTESANTVVLQSLKNWLPTFIYGNIVFFTAILGYWAMIHAMDPQGRDYIGRWKDTKHYRPLRRKR